MIFALLVGSTLVAQGAYKPDPDQFPMALHRSIEIDDLDREVRRLHDTVLLKKAGLAASQRLAKRGLLSRADLEREAAEVRYQEAREAESISYRALKTYERDVAGQAISPDEQKAYSLLLDWVHKQIEISQVDVDYRGFVLKQTRALLNRKAVQRQEFDEAELAYNTALAALALSRTREAQILMELAARKGETPYDPMEYFRLKSEYLKARVHYFHVTAQGSHRRLEMARDRHRSGLIPVTEFALFENAAADADAAEEAERKALDRHEAERPVDVIKPRPMQRPPGPDAAGSAARRSRVST